jgi:hypothetical protein
MSQKQFWAGKLGATSMNYALQAGARQQDFDSRNFDGWCSMDTAPRDGTWVELMCTYGVAPWYCIARWADEQVASGPDGSITKFKSSRPSWVTPEGGGPFDEGSLHWRPYAGNVASYRDPTGGMQNDMAYWRGAVAAKYGLPLDHFEKTAARNAARNEPASASGGRARACDGRVRRPPKG